MKIGFCMLLWTKFVTEEHEPILRDLKATGYDGVEIPVFSGEYDDYRRLGALLDEIGLERTAVTSIPDPAMNPIAPEASVRQAGINFVKWAIDCADAVGARVLGGVTYAKAGVFTGEGPTEAEKKRSVLAQREIGDHAASRKVVVALEALNRYEIYFLNSTDDLAAHVREINHPNIRGLHDTYHANIEDDDPAASFARNVDAIGHVHIAENFRGVPGAGNIKWKKTFRAMRESGYDGWLTVEAFDRKFGARQWRDLAESPEAVYRGGFKLISKGWKKAGEPKKDKAKSRKKRKRRIPQI